MVKERSWLDVYPWVKWGGNDALPVFVEGQEFVPTSLTLEQVCAVEMVAVCRTQCRARRSRRRGCLSGT